MVCLAPFRSVDDRCTALDLGGVGAQRGQCAGDHRQPADSPGGGRRDLAVRRCSRSCSPRRVLRWWHIIAGHGELARRMPRRAAELILLMSLGALLQLRLPLARQWPTQSQVRTLTLSAAGDRRGPAVAIAVADRAASLPNSTWPASSRCSPRSTITAIATHPVRAATLAYAATLGAMVIVQVGHRVAFGGRRPGVRHADRRHGAAGARRPGDDRASQLEHQRRAASPSNSSARSRSMATAGSGRPTARAISPICRPRSRANSSGWTSRRWARG